MTPDLPTSRDDRLTASALLLRVGPSVLVMAAIFLLSSRSTLPKPESISGELFSIAGHLGAYVVLAITIWWALGLADLAPRQRLLFAFAGAVLYGLSDEWHQSFVPGRSPDWRDIVTDAAGAAAGLWATVRVASRIDPDRHP
jgi:VanZ family protein